MRVHMFPLGWKGGVISCLLLIWMTSGRVGSGRFRCVAVLAWPPSAHAL
jgi:hypothetical protein